MALPSLNLNPEAQTGYISYSNPPISVGQRIIVRRPGTLSQVVADLDERGEIVGVSFNDYDAGLIAELRAFLAESGLEEPPGLPFTE